MRDLGQSEVVAKFGEVGEVVDDTTVIGLEKGLQGEDREQLVLGEVLAATDGGVFGESLSSQTEGVLGDRSRGLGHRGESLHTALETPTHQKDSTEHYDLRGNQVLLYSPRDCDIPEWIPSFGELEDRAATAQVITTKSEYDRNDRVVKVTEAYNLTPEAWAPTPTPDPTALLTHDRPVTTFEYDATGRVVAETDPLGRKTHHISDVHGRETETLRDWRSAVPDSGRRADRRSERERGVHGIKASVFGGKQAWQKVTAGAVPTADIEATIPTASESVTPRAFGGNPVTTGDKK